ncbi:pyruvate carboxylase [Christensenella sp. MSJ-20]|uniref:pyruvate carboxylase n=1 Tax=Christensenella sp. MSJ-20 TaxID=2841518 RepID=UPI0037BEF732
MVANRGEIAIRIIRACYDLGLRTVSIYTKEDNTSLFRSKADESYLIGRGQGPVAAYLDIDRIVDLAVEKHVDAIHPGYGFLSENAEFAKACEEKGIIFIGPPSHVLAQMGDKLAAKAIAKRAGVPTIPGSTKPVESVEEGVRLAQEFGYPVLLKAAAGGGGRGMRLCYDDDSLRSEFQLVKNEAEKAFGNGDIFIEKYLEDPKHIEIQVLGDNYGNIVHLYERDCSVQRRYQKVVEFTPAFTVAKSELEAMYADALKIAHEVGYVNAGTVEFLVDKHGNHYFIEMNPRIQVEHTVTEVATGVDLVQAQIMIAQGYSLFSPELNLRQEDISHRGFAIQCRVTTEDPRNNFAPDTGRMTVYRSGGGNGVRLDAGNAFAGAVISPYYDSLLVKITTFDRSFEGAVRKALRSLNEIRVRGVKTNIPFLVNVLQNPVFLMGKCDTRFIDNTPSLFNFELPQDRATKVLRYIAQESIKSDRQPRPAVLLPKVPRVPDGPLPNGYKQLLDEKGPRAVADAVLAEKRLLITDTTMRDAHQSLLATRVRSLDMLLPARAMAHTMANAFSFEMWGGATFDVAYRFLHESPWKRLDELRARIPNVLFQMLLRGANAVGYTSYPDNVVKGFIRESARRGIDVFRVFDSLNWLPGMAFALDEVASAGKIAEATICYTGDIDDPARDKYPLSYYVDLAKQLEKAGAHMLCIKDMSGLLKPYAAQRLVRALKEELSIPVHLHTHDTSGNQVAAYLLAAEAGVDIVDCALSSMSSFTSQPSLNAICYALAGTERDPGMDKQALSRLSEYWSQVRPLYAQFEAGLNSPDTQIYQLEIPGGQYSNFKPQVESLGLGHRFEEVKAMYSTVNQMLGDIIKVTPSSKMVGDLAIFMVQNNLTPDNIVERAATLHFPDSVISYFKGMMGQPKGGFPVDLQKAVLKGEEPITCRPGQLLPPVDLEAVRASLPETHRDDASVLSACLYPKVFEEYLDFLSEYSDLSSMDTHVFLRGMDPGDSTELTIEDGKTLIIKYIGPGEINQDGTQNVLFELNGAQRAVSIQVDEDAAQRNAPTMADSNDQTQIGASIPGMVSKVPVKVGDAVTPNTILAVIEAMKMETNVVSPRAGTISAIYVEKGDNVAAGQLLFRVE